MRKCHWKIISLIVLISLMFSVLGACDTTTRTDYEKIVDDIKNEKPIFEGPDSSFEDPVDLDDIDFSVETTVIEKDHLYILDEADFINNIYSFDSAGIQRYDLDISEGRIVLIYGLALRRISSVREVGSNYVVETEFAALTEAIDNAELKWDFQPTFEFSENNELVAGKWYTPLQTTPGKTKLKHTLTYGGYTFNIDLNIDKDILNFIFDIGKSGVKLEAKGNFQQFASEGQIKIVNNQVENFSNNINNLKGETSLSLIAAASGRDFIDFKPDITLMKFPFIVGGIPLEFTLNVQYVINAMVPYDGSARLYLDFDYSSDMGFSVKGAGFDNNTSLRNLKTEEERTDIASSGAVAANFGIGFPRINLGILKPPVPGISAPLELWMQPAFLLGGSFTPGINLCKRVEALFMGAVGARVNAKIYGQGFSYNLLNARLIEEHITLVEIGCQ